MTFNEPRKFQPAQAIFFSAELLGHRLFAYPAPVTTITEIKFPRKDLYHKSWVEDTDTRTWNDRTVRPSSLTGSWVLTSPNILLAQRPITMMRIDRLDGGGISIDDLNFITSTIRPAGVITLRPKMYTHGGL
jgi:hypothetical protein